MKPKLRIVAISGKAGHGKDTLAELLTKEVDKGIILHYADLIKFIYTKITNWDGVKREADRTNLQFIGSELVRQQMNMPTYWVDRVAEQIQIAYNFNQTNWFFIPDTRFPNEIERLEQKLKSRIYTVRINRPNYQSLLTPAQQQNTTETALDNYVFDYNIVNNSLETLKADAKRIIKEVS